jgi:hypothetical protein
MPTKFARILLFLSSYAPLFVVFALRNPCQSLLVEIALYGIAAISVLGLLLFIRQGLSIAATTIEIKSASNRDAEAMAYVVTYFIPFLGVTCSDMSSIVSIFLVYVVICVIYVTANLIHVNPVLNLMGYHLFEIEDTNGKPSTLITRRDYVAPHDKIPAAMLSNYILLEKKDVR